MAISQQRLHGIKISALKGLRNLDMSFTGSNVTAILGPNGNGKSTILHALAAAFRPAEGDAGENYKFSNFFLPHPDALWQGSEFTIDHSYRDGMIEHNNVKTPYAKRQDRWSPRYESRPIRDVYYIGIDKCVPLIESEKKGARVNYVTRTTNEEIIRTILEKASYVLNRQYTTLNIHDAGRGKTFMGVVENGLQYSALSMSAGEQKVFYILDRVFKARKYSLILIDEIDLLLHDGALKRLIEVMHERSNEKSLQIVFTTHRETVISLGHLINIRHIISKSGISLCFDQTRPDAIARLTGSQIRSIEIFIEDDLSAAIVNKIASQLSLSKHISTIKYGAAINCFTAAAGLLFGGEQGERSLFVLDGDVFRTDEEKQARINALITGHDAGAVAGRTRCIALISQFLLPPDSSPEKYIHAEIVKHYEAGNAQTDEVALAAVGVIAVNDTHEYLSRILTELGGDKAVGLARIVDLFAQTPAWEAYSQKVRQWLESKQQELIEA